MQALKEIEKEVQEPPSSEYPNFRTWFYQYDNDVWDTNIENDSNELSVAFDALKKGGYILIFVPALSWLYSDLDQKVGHFRRYNKRGLNKIVKEAGFEIVKSNYFDSFGIIPWYILFVLMKKEMGQGGVSFYDKFIIPIEKIVEKIISMPFGKNLLLVAKK